MGLCWFLVGGCDFGEDVSASWWRAASWLWLVGERGDAGYLFKKSWIRSLMAVVATSTDEAATPACQ
jgi:hypothetical protein